MLPYIFRLNFLNLELSLSSYSLMALLAIVSAGFVYILNTWQGRKFITAHLLQLALILVIALLGARIFQSLIYLNDHPELNWNLFAAFPVAGATVNGGLLSAFVCLFFLILFDPFKIMNFRTLDALAIAMPLGHALGRIGCFLAGCCYGSICPDSFFLALTYPSGWYADPNNTGILLHGPRWPSPLFEAFGLFLIFSLLQIFKKKFRAGRALSFYLVSYGVLRFSVELTRGNEERGFFFGFSTGQLYSVFSFVMGLILFSLLVIRDRPKGKLSADTGFFGKALRNHDLFEEPS